METIVFEEEKDCDALVGRKVRVAAVVVVAASAKGCGNVSSIAVVAFGTPTTTATITKAGAARRRKMSAIPTTSPKEDFLALVDGGHRGFGIVAHIRTLMSTRWVCANDRAATNGLFWAR